MLANADSFRAMSSYMSHPNTMRGGGLMLIAGLSLVAFWVAMTYWENYRKKQAQGQMTPTALFYELCRLHKLTREQTHLLQSCATSEKELPILFVDMELLEVHAKENSHQTVSLLKLRDALFGHKNG